mgnify:CR=1 FL=1
MFSTVLSWLTSSLSAVFGWFSSFYSYIGDGEFLGLFISMFVVFMAVKFLVIPLVGGNGMSVFGSGSSDSVKPAKKISSKKEHTSTRSVNGSKANSYASNRFNNFNYY